MISESKDAAAVRIFPTSVPLGAGYRSSRRHVRVHQVNGNCGRHPILPTAGSRIDEGSKQLPQFPFTWSQTTPRR
jgi:hypothetical protein